MLQGAASSVAAANKGAEMLLAYNEELPPEDCTEGADESDDGGARRMLRSHAAAAAAAAAGSRGGGAFFKHAALQVSLLRVLLPLKDAKMHHLAAHQLTLQFWPQRWLPPASHACHSMQSPLQKCRSLLNHTDKCMSLNADLCDRPRLSEALDMCAGPYSAGL